MAWRCGVVYPTTIFLRGRARAVVSQVFTGVIMLSKLTGLSIDSPYRVALDTGSASRKLAMSYYLPCAVNRERSTGQCGSPWKPCLFSDLLHPTCFMWAKSSKYLAASGLLFRTGEAAWRICAALSRAWLGWDRDRRDASSMACWEDVIGHRARTCRFGPRSGA